MANGNRYMQNCEAELLLSPFISVSKKSGGRIVCFSVIWHRAMASPEFQSSGATVFLQTVLCVIGRHRLLSPDRGINSDGRYRSVFDKKNYRREFFAGKPEGPEREDFALRVTLNGGTW